MEEIYDQKIPEYFAAANSYQGFISYFDKVFPSSDFERIYVLKGGPGTGKSSFMKKVAEVFYARKYGVEKILCSSDPSSLDGVIICSKNKKIAIIDGTAPHERDAIIPGAIDEIINLGQGWNSGWLAGKKEAIISIGLQKAKCYKTAYNYLSISGRANEYIKFIYKSNFDKYKAKVKAECILQEISPTENGTKSTRLVSSFGRYGERRLNTLGKLSSRNVRISGDDLCAKLFLCCCTRILEDKNINFLHLPSALDPTETDGIYLHDHNLTLTHEKDGEIDVSELFNLSLVDMDQVKKAKEINEEALNEAQRWFAIASDMHFRLESIYGEAMNFEANESLLSEKISEISNILENER